jgi:energy-coupling factor transport system permease protein
MTWELRYQDKNTVISRLNPVVKLVWGTIIIVLSLIFNHPLYIFTLLVAIVMLVKSASIWREWTSVFKLWLWLGATIILINALVSYHGNHVLVVAPFTLPVLGRPMITLEAVTFGAVMALKLLVIISSFAFVNLTVHPDDIMSVLLKMKLPYKSVLVTSLSTRFIPCLIEDLQRISDAYRTRGVPLDSGSWFRRLRNRAGIVIPLLSNSLDRAVQVAEAMEARAFGTGQKRTYYRDTKLSPMDRVILVSGLLPLGVGIMIRVFSYGDYEYYPNLETISLSSDVILIPGILTLLLLAIIPLAFLQRRVELD